MSSAETSFFRRLLDGSRGAPRRPIETLKTLAIVIPLTAMIWVYAENAQSRSEDIKVRVQFVTSNTGNAATVPGAPSEGSELSINMDGPRGQIVKFKETIEKNTVDGKLRLVLPGSNELGTRNVSIADAFKADPSYWRINVSVKSTPAELSVLVEPLNTIEVAVAPPEGLSVTLQNVSFNPPKVKVTGPQSAIRGEFGGENPRIAIDTSGLDTAATTMPRTKPVALMQPRNSRIRLSQPTVDMTYEVGSMIREAEIGRVFLDIRRPYADEGRYRVISKSGPVIFNVLVTGPSSSVSRLIGPNPVPVKAILEVTKDDADKGELTKEVKLDFSTIDPTIKPVGTYEVRYEVKSLAPGDAER